MRKRRIRLLLGGVVVFLLGAVVLAVLLEPTRILRGFVFGEPFFRERPLSYWREVLGRYGHHGHIPQETAIRFHGNEALPVLRECARDSDRNVRWPAIFLLGRGGRGSQQALDVLIQALDDEDVEVRLQAVSGLAGWGPMGRSAIPALTARLSDPEFQVAHYADLALWEIDPSAAVAACGWRDFTSPEFGFSVMMPAQAESEDLPAMDGWAVIRTFQVWHRAGPYQVPTRYTVLVGEYPKEVVELSTEEERFRALKDSVPFFFLGGKVVEEKEVSQGDLRGREYLLEVEGLGRVRSRSFWVGQKHYGLQVVHKPEFINARAAACFLDSFRLEMKLHSPP